jgi:hypothetical protein
MSRVPRPDDSHECPYPTCRRRVPPHLFACRGHWYLLPETMRSVIWRAYRRRETDPHAHIVAMAAAREWYDDHVRVIRT